MFYFYAKMVVPRVYAYAGLRPLAAKAACTF